MPRLLILLIFLLKLTANANAEGINGNIPPKSDDKDFSIAISNHGGMHVFYAENPTKPAHNNLKNNLYFSRTVVLQEEWNNIMGYNNSSAKGPILPVDCVSFNEVLEFCKKITEDAQKKGKIGNEWFFSIPTVSEWDLFCKAGGDKLEFSELEKIAATSRDGHRPSMEMSMGRQPNGWGIYDLFGPVAQFCSDEENGKISVKGLCYFESLSKTQSPYLRHQEKSERNRGVGIRLVLRRCEKTANQPLSKQAISNNLITAQK